jgi:hypothetical protein
MGVNASDGARGLKPVTAVTGRTRREVVLVMLYPQEPAGIASSLERRSICSTLFAQLAN